MKEVWLISPLWTLTTVAVASPEIKPAMVNPKREIDTAKAGDMFPDLIGNNDESMKSINNAVLQPITNERNQARLKNLTGCFSIH